MHGPKSINKSKLKSTNIPTIKINYCANQNKNKNKNKMKIK